MPQYIIISRAGPGLVAKTPRTQAQLKEIADGHHPKITVLDQICEHGPILVEMDEATAAEINSPNSRLSAHPNNPIEPPRPVTIPKLIRPSSNDKDSVK